MHYRLQLANGHRFYLTGTDETKPWLEKLVYIMQLTPSDYDPKFPRIIFVLKDMIKGTDPTQNFSPESRLSLPNFNWQLQNHKFLKYWSHPDTPDLIYPITNKEDYSANIIDMDNLTSIIFILMLDFGGVPLHSALVEKDGISVALVGQGGIGKSTCCRRIPLPWHPLSDDEILVVPDNHGNYVAHPFPTWSDYFFKRQENTWNVQEYVPLRGIFFLKRSDDDYEEIIPLGKGQSCLRIDDSANQIIGRIFNRDENSADEKNRIIGGHQLLRKKLLDNSCQLAKSIPAYKLPISLTRNFWEDIEKVIEGP